MQAEVDELIELLDLEPIEEDIFRGVSPQEDRQRVFGGQGGRPSPGGRHPHGGRPIGP